ncbi:hypothetical protein [Neobacillus sp. PS2-9]|uniref:hypothetical protein n=1 Tax=Neobacillus sp. PS2-9 TaxID=3070676 RepID=UPI0027E10044|nr:hypothetical protein [Neobacillus sp. PS2-9]WML58831.1 hypothetical protein RCG25_03260 [Neobacillus sp. PS2-9]
MNAITWQIISIVGYSLAAALLITAIVLFFKMKIPAIIGELTGRTAARQIQEIRERRENKRQKPMVFDIEPGLAAVTPVLEKADAVSKETEVLVPETEVLFDDVRVVPMEKVDRPAAASMGQSHNRVVPLSLTDILAGYTEEPASPSIDVEKELLLSLTEVLSNEKEERVTPVPVQSKERDVLLSLTEILSSHIEEPSLSVEVPKEVLLSLTEILSQNTEERTAVKLNPSNLSAISPSNGTEVLSTAKEVPEVRRPQTEVLSHETEVLDYGTELLSDEGGTTVLTPTGELEMEEETDNIPAVDFKVVKDIKVTHTNKVI